MVRVVRVVRMVRSLADRTFQRCSMQVHAAAAARIPPWSRSPGHLAQAPRDCVAVLVLRQVRRQGGGPRLGRKWLRSEVNNFEKYFLK